MRNCKEKCWNWETLNQITLVNTKHKQKDWFWLKERKPITKENDFKEKWGN